MSPNYQERVARALQNAPTLKHASPWRIYSRLARPGIIAIRTVTRATGLDIFLLENKELRGVEDVAEMIFFAIEDVGTPGLMDSLDPTASLFITFLRLNWDILNSRQLWRDYGLALPSKSQIFRSFRTALRKAAGGGILSGDPLTYHVGGGIGDCDALITGSAFSREGVNRFLLTLSQLGTDSIALELGADASKITRSYPIAAASVTELGIGWDLFSDALGAARIALDHIALDHKLGKELDPAEESMRERVNRSLEGDLRAAIFLKRSHSSLASVRDQLKEILPRWWVKQEVLGDADLLLRFREKTQKRSQDLEDLVCLTARLDQKAAENASFPRRHSVVLSFDSANPSGLPEHARATVLGQEVYAAGVGELTPVPLVETSVEEELSKCVIYLNSIHNLRLREELRIVERMVERCAILQRQADLPAETRRVSQLGLSRIARTLEHLNSGDANADNEWRIALRHSLVNSGAHLERTISHLSRGNVPMLLATPTQARAMDHFSSETMLATALAAPASSAASKLATALKKMRPPHGKAPLQWTTLMEALEDMAEPIIYTSHGLDFMLARPLGIIHVPRWIMWYPTSSSLILHEVGHAVFSDGRLDDLLRECAEAVVKHAVLGDWCKELMEGSTSFREGPGRLTGAPRQWRSDQHEIAAELFNRLFSYPVDGDQGYLSDQLEYLHAIINRSDEIERVSFITRAFTVHIAHALMLRSDLPGAIWDLSAAELQIWVREAVAGFRGHLRQWLRSPPPPFESMSQPENLQLLNEVKELAGTLALQSESDGTLRDFSTAVGRSVQRGIFMALVARSRGVVKNETNGTLTAHMVWEATLQCSQEPESPAAREMRKEFDEALGRLQKGEVPDFICPWPERLPRMLQHAIRKSPEASVLIQHRMALSLYLADWMSLHQRSREPLHPGGRQDSPAQKAPPCEK